jgi:hypothetical protein
MFTSDTLTPIMAELLRKNNWNGVFDIPQNRQYAFVANYNDKVAKLVNNVVWNGLDVILTDEWTFTLEDINLTKTPSETDLIAKVSTVKYMEDLAFLLDLCHISWVNLKF